MIPIKTIRELYRVDNKYWKIGDIDILPKRRELGQKVDEEFYSEICGIARIVTQKHYPVKKLIEVLEMLGYEIEKEEEE